MLQSLLEVGHLSLQPFDESLGYLAEEDTALAAGVKEGGVGVLKQLLWEHVDNLVGQFGRCEHLVVAQVRDAREYIGVVDAVKQTIVLHSGYVCVIVLNAT